MSAQLASQPALAAARAPVRPPDDERSSFARALAFTAPLLEAQKVPLLARRSASRALALLLARSVARRGEPVVLSAEEGAHQCGFEPRTWWLVKRRLLELGHLVASAGGIPPSGRPGGRGRRGAYFVAPATLARFLDAKPLLEAPPLDQAKETANDARETANDRPKTVKGRPETLNAPGEERDLSHHRPRALRVLEKERTSDVPSSEGDERPSVEAVWAWVRAERSERVKLRLLRLLETLLVIEALPRAQETENAPRKTLMPLAQPPQPQGDGPRRRLRAAEPLWKGEEGEEAQVLAQVRGILAWANREHRATFDVEKSARDTLRYPFEQVRGAVSNVLLKKARGYRFANPGAVLWDGITLEGYKLDEFSVARFDEVLARLDSSRAVGPRPPVPQPPPIAKPASVFEPERRRRILLQELYQGLGEEERRRVDERAETLAREELGVEASPLKVRLRALDVRSDLLAERLPGPQYAGESERAPQESQIPHFASARDETEPNTHPCPRT